MNNKIMLLILLILSISVYADWQFIDLADDYHITPGCNPINPNAWNDSNWTTQTIYDGVTCFLYSNYSMDQNLIYTYAQYSLGNTHNYYDVYNYSLAGCVKNPLQLRNKLAGVNQYVWCHNGVEWKELGNRNAKSGTRQTTEEGIWAIINYTGTVDNCSTHTHKALNFTLKDANGSSIMGSFAGIIQLSEGQKFNLTYQDAEYFEVCIKRDWMAPTYNAQFEFGASGYDIESHYISDQILNNDTDTIELILNKDNETSSVYFTVTDENDNPVDGLLINIMEYDLATDSSTSTEIVSTNSNGVAIANVILYDQRYKFILTKDSQVYLETSDIFLTGTSYGFRINLGENFYDSFAIVHGASCLTTFSNSTGTFEFVWVDDSQTVNKGCLEITKTIPLGTTTVYDGCISSYGGSLSHNVSATDGNVTYIGQGFIELNGQKYICGESVSFSYDTTYKKYGEMGAYATFLIILVVVLAGLWHPGVAVGFGAVVIMLSVWMKFIYLGWGTLAGLIIIALLTIYRLNK